MPCGLSSGPRGAAWGWGRGDRCRAPGGREPPGSSDLGGEVAIASQSACIKSLCCTPFENHIIQPNQKNRKKGRRPSRQRLFIRTGHWTWDRPGHKPTCTRLLLIHLFPKPLAPHRRASRGALALPSLGPSGPSLGPWRGQGDPRPHGLRFPEELGSFHPHEAQSSLPSQPLARASFRSVSTGIVRTPRTTSSRGGVDTGYGFYKHTRINTFLLGLVSGRPPLCTPRTRSLGPRARWR